MEAPLPDLIELAKHRTEMTEQDILSATILGLMGRRTEGLSWDFKLKHHDNKADIVHDVLCLANADHAGQRYLVFGVDDQSFEVSSIVNTPGRRSQADIVSVFRDNARKFFQSRIPEFYLVELQYEGKLLDALVIEDRPHKPYYLVEDYVRDKKRVRAHHIYTRIGDTNTPLPDSAPPHEIERMWRERFGLDKPPLERAKRYLEEPEEWVAISEDPLINLSHYHRTFPEFTLTIADANNPVVACNEEWTLGEIRAADNSAAYYKLYYHQTLLNRTRFVIFDHRKKSMVAPGWEPRGAGRFYFYRADSIAYALQSFQSRKEQEDHSTTLGIRGAGAANNEARALWPRGMRIPVLQAGELDGFLGPKEERTISSPSTDEDEQYRLFLRNQLDFEEWREKRDRP